MNDSNEQIFEKFIDAMERGEQAEKLASRFPEHREEAEGVARAISLLKEGRRHVVPRPEIFKATLARISNAAHGDAASRPASAVRSFFARPVLFVPAGALAAVLILVASFGTVKENPLTPPEVLSLKQDALPESDAGLTQMAASEPVFDAAAIEQEMNDLQALNSNLALLGAEEANVEEVDAALANF